MLPMLAAAVLMIDSKNKVGLMLMWLVVLVLLVAPIVNAIMVRQHVKAVKGNNNSAMSTLDNKMVKHVNYAIIAVMFEKMVAALLLVVPVREANKVGPSEVVIVPIVAIAQNAPIVHHAIVTSKVAIAISKVAIANVNLIVNRALIKLVSREHRIMKEK